MQRWRGNRKRAGMAVEAGSVELITLSCQFHVDMKIPLIRSIKKKDRKTKSQGFCWFAPASLGKDRRTVSCGQKRGC